MQRTQLQLSIVSMLRVALAILFAVNGSLLFAQVPETPISEPQTSETQASETQASETQASETQASETQASETQASEALRIELEAGTASSDAIFQAVAGDLHWIAGEVATVTKSLALTDDSVRISSDQLNGLVARFPTIFTIEHDTQGGSSALVINRVELVTQLSNKKSSLRNWLASLDNHEMSSLTEVAGTFPLNGDAPERVVVAMAGLHGLTAGAEEVCLELHKLTHLPMCVFDYPNDEPIQDSAERLQTHLAELHAKYPASKITLVTHSMGGLVSRSVLETIATGGPTTPQTQSGSPSQALFGVDQLIQVCPPNHGSAIAEYGPLLEGVEQISRLVNRSNDSKSRVLLGMIVDGFNEAPADLRRDSDFLKTLNAHPRASGVRYSILAGNAGPLKGGMAMLLGGVWATITEAVDEPDNLNRRIQDLLQSDDLHHGKGDGVVAVSSAKLSGVKDFEVLPMNHLTWSQLDSEAGQQMLREISKRLEAHP